MAKRFYVELGKLLQTYRNERNLSQQDVADRLRVSRSAIAGYEQARRYINIDDLFKLCEIYGVDPNIPLGECKKYLYKE